MRQHMKQTQKDFLGKITLAIAGMLIFSAGINFFIVPADLYNGGMLGISQLIRTVLVKYLHLFSGSTDIAGIINIFCMTAWWGIYSSKDKKDMLWPDMTWCYILAYDLWNFEYTYNCLPTHSWYCGLALLLAPTFANHFWNKGGWIQNRANTLALWCMFAQVFPLFQDNSVFTTITSVYADGFMNPAVRPTAANPTAQGVVAIIALVVNVVILASIIKRAKAQKKNPYKQEIFCDQKDFQEAMARV